MWQLPNGSAGFVYNTNIALTTFIKGAAAVV